jgi:hypothetical protein
MTLRSASILGLLALIAVSVIALENGAADIRGMIGTHGFAFDRNGFLPTQRFGRPPESRPYGKPIPYHAASRQHLIEHRSVIRIGGPNR